MNDYPEPHDLDHLLDPACHSTGRALLYVCVDCAKEGLGKWGFDHHVETGHAIRGKHWNPNWPNCQFSDADSNGRRVKPAQRRSA